MAEFIRAQRAEYGIPQRVSCQALRVSDSWFYKQVTPAVMSALLGYPSERRRLRRAEALTVSEGTGSKHSGSVLTELDPPLPDSTSRRVLAVPAHLWG